MINMTESDRLNTEEGRAKFIRENESGIYAGKTEDGLECRVYIDKGESMSIYTEQAGKPDWWEVAYYDEDGYLEGYTYERRA